MNQFRNELQSHSSAVWGGCAPMAKASVGTPKRADTAKNVIYKSDPSHQKLPTLYMKQLRDDGNFKTCDVELRLNNTCVRIHSAVIAPHSAKVARLIAESHEALRIDMSEFKVESVNKVVEWLYSGEVELRSDNIGHDLSATHYLGVMALHKQLEQTLISQAHSPKTRIEAVNVATSPDSGITEGGKDTVMKILYDNRAAITANEIMALSPWAVKALVSARVNKSVKIALVNISINWLRHPRNIPHAEAILPLITIDQMKKTELDAFQQTLKTALRNPSTRQVVTVALDASGRPVIRMDKGSFQRNAGKTVQDLDSKKLSPSIFAQLIPKAMNEIRLITDEDSEGSDDENLPSYKATKKHASDRKQKKSPAESPAPQSKSSGVCTTSAVNAGPSAPAVKETSICKDVDP
ncbi:hypothetical protein GCK32_005077 [Trichostrongylus colubriformis]|uniref:BTB domain-containing protein n=1 Tax=Trichostrongylus colubriformis TaxID=6319 RepID=A0AAN8F072_TRICO